jgi:hypothetical protein
MTAHRYAPRFRFHVLVTRLMQGIDVHVQLPKACTVHFVNGILCNHSVGRAVVSRDLDKSREADCFMR